MKLLNKLRSVSSRLSAGHWQFISGVGGPDGKSKSCTEIRCRTVGPTLIRRTSMLNRVMLLVVFSTLILCLAGCGGDEEKKAEPAPAAAPAAAAKKAEEAAVAEVTTNDD